MKKIHSIFVALLLLSVSVFAQAPENMSYQAVVRDNSNTLVTNATVGMRVSILQGSATGTAVYVETQTPTSNANGLVSIEIGGGTVVSGSLADIDWSSGPYFIKTETDPAGGTTYTITGTSQLLSVPYARYSEIGGLKVKKLHSTDELDLVLGSTTGPNEPGSSTDIGDVSEYKGLILEWRMNSRSEVFQQFIYLSDYDKDVILGNISPPSNYPRRYTTILSDGFGNIMWLGVSIQGNRLYLSTNSAANPSPRLERIYAFY